MFGLGLTELIIVFLIVLVLFGAKKLPQIGDGMGTAIRNFKNSIAPEVESDLKQVTIESADHGRIGKERRRH